MNDDSDNDPQPSRGHPPGLYVLFSAEMWERFCYYTMRGLLTLYLVKALAMGDTKAFAIYGAYTALVYAAPVLGGQIADKILGYRKAVILGGVMMAIGEGVICIGNEHMMYLGMGVIIVGNGYFKANISTIVGKLYKQGDPRRDSGFTIFYMGINVGAVLATLIGAPVGEGLSKGPMGEVGYLVGFGLAGVGMLAGLAFFIMGRKKLQGQGEPPNPEKLYAPMFAGLSQQTITIILSFAVIPFLYVMLQYKSLVDGLLIVALVVVAAQLLIAAFGGGDKTQRDKILVLMILMVFNVVFWACFEQAGSSLTLFADRNVDRSIFGLVEMPASMTQFFNPAFIIIFGSVFSWLWVFLDRKKLNPNIPLKFGIGIFLLGGGYLMLYLGSTFAQAALVPLFVLAFMYLLHTLGELFLSPIGLSMVTKLAPPKMTGQVMGAWFLSFAFANSLAASLAQLTGAEKEVPAIDALVDQADQLLEPRGAIDALIDGGREMLTPDFLQKAAEAAEASLASYVDIYTTMGLISAGIGLGLALLSPLLNKMMHGVR